MDVAAWGAEVVLDFLAAVWVAGILAVVIQAVAIRAAVIREAAEAVIRNRAAAIPAVDRPAAVTRRKTNR